MRKLYLPMLAESAEEPFSSPDWIFEIKWDGVRAIATVGSTVSLASRNGTELAGQFPELAELLTLAPGTVLDGDTMLHAMVELWCGAAPDAKVVGVPISASSAVDEIAARHGCSVVRTGRTRRTPAGAKPRPRPGTARRKRGTPYAVPPGNAAAVRYFSRD